MEDFMHQHSRLLRRIAAFVSLSFACVAPMVALAASPSLMVIGIDEKITWDDAGKPVFSAQGRDVVAVVDIGSDPLAPKIVASLPLMNTIFGPPVNLAITPDGSLALVANSMDWAQDGASWKPVPDNKLYVIDLKSSPPKLIETLQVGKQPSGLSINRAGNLALIANRADSSLSVLSISGKTVKLIDTVVVGEPVAHVVFTPDGKRAFAVKFNNHKVAQFNVESDKVTYDKASDMPVGLWPYNIDVTPDGKLAITADNGNSGSADGHIDTVSVIDLEAKPVRVIDRVVVGDAPEGFAISPTGKLAVAILLKGTNAAKNAWFYNRNGSVAVLKIDGKKLTKVGEVDVRGLPEGVVFSPDGQYIYVGNFLDSDVSILKVEGERVVNTGKSLVLPGKPASMRGKTQ